MNVGNTGPVKSEAEFSRAELELSIPTRFEKIARVYPDHIALKEGSTSLTYSELNAGANRIAQHIRARYDRHIGSVALLFDQKSKTVMAMLGALKAGRAYVALDPGYPTDQLRYMLRDSEAMAVVTDRANAGLALDLSNDPKNLINIDELHSASSSSQVSVPPQGTTVSALYYTSGSTGTPKGVIQNHRNILHRAWLHAFKNNVHQNDRQTLLFSPSFTASLPDIYGALLSGATLCAYDLKINGLASFSDWLITERISIIHPPVSLLREFVETLAQGDQFPDVRLIILGGQSIYDSDVTAFRRHCSKDCVVEINLASTEASIHTQYLVQSSDKLPDDFVPVGYAAEDKKILILDDSMQPLQSGEKGEIGVRSQFISPGYWNDPKLTEQKFIPGNSDGQPAMYLTGDIGRMHAGGVLEYIGRQDSQFKIRGFRIEFSEIEAAIHQMEIVSQAALVAEEDQLGNKQLIAYVVPAVNKNPSTAELRRSLGRTLPSQMIPSRFVMLEALPQTPSGKIDYETLAETSTKENSGTYSVVAPRNDIEATLLEIWQETLGTKQIGINSNFFELGGHSLLGLRLFLKIESAFDKKFPLASLFSSSTIAEQAELITDENVSGEWPSLIGIQPHGTKQKFYCVSPLGIDVLAYRGLAMKMGSDQPFYALFSHGSNYRHPFSVDLREQALKYVAEIRSFQPKGPYILGGYSGGGVVALEMARQLQAVNEEVPFVALLEAYGPDYPAYKAYLPEFILGSLGFVRRIDKNIHDFTPWLKMHFDNLNELGWAGRLGYIQFKMNHRVTASWNSIRRRFGKVVSGLQGMKEPKARRYFETWENYKIAPYSTKVILFRAEKQPLGSFHDPLMGWADLLTGEIDTHELPGYHDSILFGPRVHHLAKLLSRAIEAHAIND